MRLNIALDGPVGAGKSSVADAVAARLKILHLDTGAMYRALGLACLRQGIDLKDEEAVTEACGRAEISVTYGENGQHTWLEGEDITGLIRTEEVSMAASCVGRFGGVRRIMVANQQRLAASHDMLVDGRDICLRVLPDAPVKIFLTASPEARAMRRFLELQRKGTADTYEQVLEDLKRRDDQDMNREVDPLRPTPDAHIVDTSEMSFEESVEAILKIVEETVCQKQ